MSLRDLIRVQHTKYVNNNVKVKYSNKWQHVGICINLFALHLKGDDSPYICEHLILPHK